MTTRNYTIASSPPNRKEFAEAFGMNQAAVRRLEALTLDVTKNLPQGIDSNTDLAMSVLAILGRLGSDGSDAERQVEELQALFMTMRTLQSDVSRLFGLVNELNAVTTAARRQGPSISYVTIDGCPIGSAVPVAGAFSSLTSNSLALNNPLSIAYGGTGANNVSSARNNLGLGSIATQNANAVAITGGAIDGTNIGQSTPAAATFTNLAATGYINPSSTNGIVGTTTNDNANAGRFGEYVQSTSGSISLTNGVDTNVTSISLTAGDWDVTGNVYFATGAGDTMVAGFTGVSTTSATQPAIPFYNSLGAFSMGPSNAITAAAPVQRISIAATTTVYLVARGYHSGGTLTAQGIIRARRVR